MKYEEFRKYEPGSVLNIVTDRLNGDVHGEYVFLGFDESGKPKLVNTSNYFSDSESESLFLNLDLVGIIKSVEDTGQSMAIDPDYKP